MRTFESLRLRPVVGTTLGVLLGFSLVASSSEGAEWRRWPGVMCVAYSGTGGPAGAGAPSLLNGSNSASSFVCPIINELSISNDTISWGAVDVYDASGSAAAKVQVCRSAGYTDYNVYCGSWKYANGTGGGGSSDSSPSWYGATYLTFALSGGPEGGHSNPWWTEGYASAYVSLPAYDGVIGVTSKINGVYITE